VAKKRNANAAASAAAQAAAQKQRESDRQKQTKKSPNRGFNGGASMPSSSPTPAAPGPDVSAPRAPRPPTAPFLTPEQQMALNEYLGKVNSELSDLGYNYAQQAANVSRDAGDIAGGNYRDVTAPDGSTYREYLGGGQLSNRGTLWARGAGQQQSNNNALIARGLTQSSVRDTDLGDIEAATTLARSNMLSSLAQLSTSNERSRSDLSSGRTQAQQGYNALAVQNAQAVDESMEPDTPAAPAAPAGPSVAKPSVSTPRLNLRNQQASNNAAQQAANAAANAARQQAQSQVPGAKKPKTVKVGTSFNGGARGR
jgi:hypothetical protein